jgi:hypothetical protein
MEVNVQSQMEWNGISKKDGNMPRIFGRNILRTIYGPINENCTRRTSYNNEYHTLNDEVDIFKEIQFGR